VSAQSSQGAGTSDERLRVFDQVWRAIFDNYYDKQFRGIDWRSQREFFRPQVEAARSNSELYKIIRKMIGKLGDAHTRVYSPEDGFDRHRPAGTTVGVTVRRIEDKSVVVWVEQGTEAARQGIRPGYTVTQVDGISVDKMLERIRNDIGESSTQTALELQSYDRLFSGSRDTPVVVTFADQEGRLRPVTLVRRFIEYQRRVIVKKLPYKIGFIEITGFGPEVEKDFEIAMAEVHGSQGLILDLRNNGGGFVTSVAQIASYFFPEEISLGEFINRRGYSTPRHTQKMRTVYRGPVIVMVSSRSASGSEIFAAAMQERKRALIIGANQTTCGCLLGVSRTLKLLDGGKLNVSDTDFRTAMGRRIEGIGVKPDQYSDIRVIDLLAGRDRTLDYAIGQLGRLIAFGSRNYEIEFKLNIPTINSPSSIGNSPTSQFRR
jgi:carboxyl-terminal processing protease